MDFIALDIETANGNLDSVCEIGLVKFKDGIEVSSWTRTIRPALSWELEPVNFSKHGISQEEILSSPSLAQVWDEVSEFLEGLPLVAHGATQDINKLLESAKAAMTDTSTFPSSEYFCSLVLAKRTSVLSLSSFSLRSLAEEFQISSPDIERNGLVVHSAESDARACGRISLALLEVNKVKSLHELAKKLEVKNGQIENLKITRRSVHASKNSFFGTSVPNAADYALMQQELSDAGWAFEGHILAGKSFVLTLSLDSLTDNEFILACALVGAEVKSGVSSKLDYLVEGHDPTGKYRHGETGKSIKARELNQDLKSKISIIKESEFMELMGPDVIEVVREISDRETKAKLAKNIRETSPQDKEQQLKYEKAQSKRSSAESTLEKFLKNPTWAHWKLSPGHTICFTQLDYEIEEVLTQRSQELGITVIKGIRTDLDLLVIEDSRVDGSAKLRDAVARGIEVTLLSYFLEGNPEIAAALPKKTKQGWRRFF